MKLELDGLEPGLVRVLLAIADSVSQIAGTLRTLEIAEAGSTNSFGDTQLQADLVADKIIFDSLRASNAVATATSEETSDMVDLGGEGYSVAFDPLDGSSIVGANFAVGSIFGIWPGSKIIGSTGREQVAAAYSVYGPRTLLMWAIPSPDGGPMIVQEYMLQGDTWQLTKAKHRIARTAKCFAPANMRSAGENPHYQELLQSWIAGGFKLRYSGGMVPDVHHIIAKGGGLFCNPCSASAPAKLRLVYECAPLALVVEAAGGMSHDGEGSLLERVMDSANTRTVVCLGSSDMVEASIPALQHHLKG